MEVKELFQQFFNTAKHPQIVSEEGYWHHNDGYDEYVEPVYSNNLDEMVVDAKLFKQLKLWFIKQDCTKL